MNRIHLTQSQPKSNQQVDGQWQVESNSIQKQSLENGTTNEIEIHQTQSHFKQNTNGQ